MTKIFRHILIFFTIFLSCQFANANDYEKFTIGYDSVGPIKKGMSFFEVKKILEPQYILKDVQRAEVNRIGVFKQNGEELLQLLFFNPNNVFDDCFSPIKKLNNSKKLGNNCLIENVEVHNKKIKTIDGIYIGMTLKELKQQDSSIKVFKPAEIEREEWAYSQKTKQKFKMNYCQAYKLPEHKCKIIAISIRLRVR